MVSAGQSRLEEGKGLLVQPSFGAGWIWVSSLGGGIFLAPLLIFDASGWHWSPGERRGLRVSARDPHPASGCPHPWGTQRTPSLMGSPPRSAEGWEEVGVGVQRKPHTPDSHTGGSEGTLTHCPHPRLCCDP